MKEFTLCSTTGAMVSRWGHCSVHDGDACLKQFVAKGEVYGVTRLDALRKLRREGYHVVDDDLWKRHVLERMPTPAELWEQAGRTNPNPAGRAITYTALLIANGYIEELEQATPVEPGGVTDA